MHSALSIKNTLHSALPARRTVQENPLFTVRELMGRVRSVVLMSVYLDLGNPGGSGFWAGGYMSPVREMGKPVYEQPGNEVDGSCHN